MGAPLRSRRIALLLGLVALVALGAFAATRALQHGFRTPVETEMRQRARAVGLEAAEALRQDNGRVEILAKAIAAKAPIIAQVGRVNAETIRNSIKDEPYWRDELKTLHEPIAGLLSNQADEAVVGPATLGTLDRGDLHADAMVEMARTERTSASGLLLIRGEAYQAATAVVAANASPPVVVFLAEPLRTERLAKVAERVHGTVLLTDGHRLLGEAGDLDARAHLAPLAGQEGSREMLDGDLEWAASAQEVAPGLFLWTAIDTRPLAEQAKRALQVPIIATWAAAAVVALVLLLVAFRRSAPAEAAGPLSQTFISAPTSLPPPPAHSTAPGLEGTSPSLASPVPIPLTQMAPSFGRYVLVDRLGSGGMGDVYLAVVFGAEGFRRSFVVKRLRAELARDSRVVNQFIDEARLASSLVHSNIIPVFDFGKVGDEYFMAQEYIAGRDLERLTAKSLEVDGKPLPPHLLYFVAHQVLQALAYAHGKSDDAGRPLGLVHRDVSPQNVMISARGEVKLLDFGIVKATARATQTEAGVVKGNVNYMAPEQARGAAIDGRADLFSLGLVLYRCLAGQSLYGEGGTYELLMHAAHGLMDTDLARIAALPAPAPALLARALATDVSQRFASAQEFAAALPPPSANAPVELAAIVERFFGSELAQERAKLAQLPAPLPEAAGGRT